MDALIEQYGLDDPIPQQYMRWVKSAAKGDLGFSKTGKQPVTVVIFSHLPATVELALWSIFPIIFVGIQLGILAALRHNKPVDHVLRIFSIIGTSTPSFMAGLLLLMYFAAYLGILPTGERLIPEYQRLVDGETWNTVTRMYTFDAIINGRFDVFWDAFKHLILPIVTLSYISWAVLLRVTRSSMLETLRQDYVTTARAKGLRERVVIQKHARPNAMLPVVTVGGFELIGLLNGVAITETVFNYPGIGKRFIDAATNLDIITVLGFVLFSGTVLILGNLCVDVLYAWLDPRIRLD
jgi:peptide/nickel transport system permease protein